MEILKWTATGLTVVFVGGELSDRADPANAWNQHGFLTLTAVAGGIAAIAWGFDLAQVGDVPWALPQ